MHITPISHQKFSDLVYETLNSSNTVFKVIDRNSGNRLVVKHIQTRCAHFACIGEEEAWDIIKTQKSNSVKLVDGRLVIRC